MARGPRTLELTGDRSWTSSWAVLAAAGTPATISSSYYFVSLSDSFNKRA